MSTLRQVDADNDMPRRSTRVSARLESVQSRHSTQAPPLDRGVWPVASRARQARKAQGKPRRREPPQVVPRGDILFPVEVWKLVFEYLHDELDQRHFARAVRFLSALHHEAEGLLYKKPLLAGTTSAVRFAESISQSTHRARAVEALTIKVTARDNKTSELYLDTLSAILDAVSRLVSLEMWGDLRSASARPFSGSWNLSTLLKGKSPPLRYIRGYPVRLDASYATTLQVLGPQLEEVRLLSQAVILNEPAVPGTLADVELPNLHTLACDIFILHQMKATRNITHLWLVDRFDAQAINEAIDLLGPQLVSLRIEQTSNNPQGPMYPTERPVRWERCTRLKFLHIDDIVDYRRYDRWSPEAYYGGRTCWGDWLGRVGLALGTQPHRLPPVLETLVWAPAWVRKVAEDSRMYQIGEPGQTHRYVLRRFAEVTLERFSSLEEFLYMWSDEGYFHCMLSSEGDLLEAHTDREHVYYNAWAAVPANSQV
ncbi:hypothetical protein C8T65DRAFT_737867 [Cerioporus squamosus]|nr:hypothetical protein C8T65DRAFT_737867 [Cerioporus squamosus]